MRILLLLFITSSVAFADWQQMSPQTSPSARHGHVMAYDPVGGGVILFGGADAQGNVLGDTWRWDGTNWTLLSPQASPPPRVWAAMTLDVCLGRILLFGGAFSAAPWVVQPGYGDTWEWDGGTWIQLNPAHSPCARWNTAMASDLRRRRTVLFGGGTVGGAANGSDTWEWNGSDWTYMNVAGPTHSIPMDPNHPGVLYSFRVGVTAHSMAYDPIRGRVVQAGGIATNDPYGPGIYSYDGTGWILEAALDGPNNPPSIPEGVRTGFAYDENRGGVVWFSGGQWVVTGGDPSVGFTWGPGPSTWDWTANELAPIPTSAGPAIRSDLGMAFDPSRRKMVLFGGMEEVLVNGWPSNSYTAVNETWELEAPSRGADIVFAPGAGPGGGAMEVIERPNIGVSRYGQPPDFSWASYMQANGELHVACGDLDGDGGQEIVVGMGSYPVAGGWLAVFGDGNHGMPLLKWIHVPWSAYDAANGATWPACGDLDGDGSEEIVVGLGSYPIAGGWCPVFSDAKGGFQLRTWVHAGWAGYDSANGEVRPAVGDLDGDGRAEVVFGFGRYPAAGGWLEVHDDFASGFGRMAWLHLDWPQYDLYNGGTYPSLGDIDGDGRCELAIGTQSDPGYGGRIRILDDALGNFAPLAWVTVPWGAYDAANGETHPALEHGNVGHAAELICGLGIYPSAGGWVAVFPNPLHSNAASWVHDPNLVYDGRNGAEFVAHGRLH